VETSCYTSETVADNLGCDAAKWGGGVAAVLTALVAAVRSFLKARNTNSHDRIRTLERQMREMKDTIEDLPASVESIQTRMRSQEVSLTDFRREVRDSLVELHDTVERTLKRLERD
jgi:gas vesicle protein